MPDQSNLHLMALQIDTLFRCDAAGRLLCVNEMGEPLAPRFFMGRTVQGNLWRFRHDLPADVVEALDHLCRAEPVAVDLTQPPRQETAIKRVLQQHAPLGEEYRGPAYWIPDGIPAPPNVVLINPENGELLRRSFPWLLPVPKDNGMSPIAATVVDDHAVAVCFCSRIPGRATEAGLETVAAFQGKGYGSASVAGWAAAVHRLGCLPLYSTAWENLASQGVARKLGMRLYGEDWSLG